MVLYPCPSQTTRDDNIYWGGDLLKYRHSWISTKLQLRLAWRKKCCFKCLKSWGLGWVVGELGKAASEALDQKNPVDDFWFS